MQGNCRERRSETRIPNEADRGAGFEAFLVDFGRRYRPAAPGYSRLRAWGHWHTDVVQPRNASRLSAQLVQGQASALPAVAQDGVRSSAPNAVARGSVAFWRQTSSRGDGRKKNSASGKRSRNANAADPQGAQPVRPVMAQEYARLAGDQGDCRAEDARVVVGKISTTKIYMRHMRISREVPSATASGVSPDGSKPSAKYKALPGTESGCGWSLPKVVTRTSRAPLALANSTKARPRPCRRKLSSYT